MAVERGSDGLRRAALACGVTLLIMAAPAGADPPGGARRPRPAEVGIHFGVLPTGAADAITDVPGVLVGHATLIEGERLHTGVTAILPHGGNLFQDKVPAGLAVGNGFGKLMGSTQITDLGEIETPVLLTNTLSVPEAAAASIGWTLRQPGNEEVRSVNAVVGETNDATLNDIRARAVTTALATQAILAARAGPVAEGAVGAGAGTVAFGWKGGIGTASRVLPGSLGGWSVGVLVQSNFGGILDIAGVPVGVKLGQYYLKEALGTQRDAAADGSCMIVIATDAPLSDRNLRRLAARAFLGLARTGSPITNGSGDYAVAFSTHPDVRRTARRRGALTTYPDLPNEAVSPLFQAVSEATEEAVINSLFAAVTVKGFHGTVQALPLEKVLPLMGAAGGR